MPNDEQRRALAVHIREVACVSFVASVVYVSDDVLCMPRDLEFLHAGVP